jgi:hypothetical protein
VDGKFRRDEDWRRVGLLISAGSNQRNRAVMLRARRILVQAFVKLRCDEKDQERAKRRQQRSCDNGAPDDRFAFDQASCHYRASLVPVSEMGKHDPQWLLRCRSENVSAR